MNVEKTNKSKKTETNSFMLHRLILHLLALVPLSIVSAESKVPIPNERIVLIGNGLGERMAGHPYLEARLQM